MWTSWRPRWLPWPLESYIDGVHNLGEPQSWLFPIFPWTAFAFIGLAAGFLLLSDRARKLGAATFMLAGMGGIGLIYLARWLDARPEQTLCGLRFLAHESEFFSDSRRLAADDSGCGLSVVPMGSGAVGFQPFDTTWDKLPCSFIGCTLSSCTGGFPFFRNGPSIFVLLPLDCWQFFFRWCCCRYGALV